MVQGNNVKNPQGEHAVFADLGQLAILDGLRKTRCVWFADGLCDPAVRGSACVFEGNHSRRATMGNSAEGPVATRVVNHAKASRAF